jgi:hypothetical protein
MPSSSNDFPSISVLFSRQDGQSRTIRQFQFTDWPEQGVPKSGEGFIDFIGQVHKTKEQFGQDGPISVHCSAGAGRTGVFTTLSIVLERMRYEGVVDMFQTVKMLRTQRPAMVQTEVGSLHFHSPFPTFSLLAGSVCLLLPCGLRVPWLLRPLRQLRITPMRDYWMLALVLHRAAMCNSQHMKQKTWVTKQWMVSTKP